MFAYYISALAIAARLGDCGDFAQPLPTTPPQDICECLLTRTLRQAMMNGSLIITSKTGWIKAQTSQAQLCRGQTSWISLASLPYGTEGKQGYGDYRCLAPVWVQ